MEFNNQNYFQLLNLLTANPKPWPKLVLQNRFGNEIAFNLSRRSNIIWVTNNKYKFIYGFNGKRVYAKIYFITKTNKSFIDYYNSCNKNIQLGINYLLNLYLTAPEIYAKKYASKEGQCMFCKKKLTHPASIHHGYGAVCAANYSLYWGGIVKSKKRKQIKPINKIYKFKIMTQLEMEI